MPPQRQPATLVWLAVISLGVLVLLVWWASDRAQKADAPGAAPPEATARSREGVKPPRPPMPSELPEEFPEPEEATRPLADDLQRSADEGGGGSIATEPWQPAPLPEPSDGDMAALQREMLDTEEPPPDVIERLKAEAESLPPQEVLDELRRQSDVTPPPEVLERLRREAEVEPNPEELDRLYREAELEPR